MEDEDYVGDDVSDVANIPVGVKMEAAVGGLGSCLEKG